MQVYIVVSYDSIECCNRPAKVTINGIYLEETQALDRQNVLCGGNVQPIYHKSLSVIGTNGVISWIKTCKIGDLENIDINSPS